MLGLERREAEEADVFDLIEISAGALVGLSYGAPKIALRLVLVLLQVLGKCAAAGVAGLVVAGLLAVAKCAAAVAVRISKLFE